MIIYSVKEKLKTTFCRMGCRTILPNMEKLPLCMPLQITSSNNVAVDYGNHVIEALLKMSSDTDDDDDQSFEQSTFFDTRSKNLLSSAEPTPMPPVILHSQTRNYKLYCSPMSHNSTSNMGQSPANQLVSLKSHGLLSPPMSSSLSSTSSWPKKTTKYSKEDSFSKFVSDKRQVCSNDERRKPTELNVTTPRLEKRPTYANLSSIHRIETDNEANIEHLSTSSLSSLTDGYPAFTGDTSDCPYGQNYNKPRGLTKFEYHSHYIKQCRIEKTARTKKVWEKSPKRQQVISRKRKLIKKCQLENCTEQNTATSAHHERKKKFHSNTKSCRKKRIVNSNLKSKNNSSRNFQNQFSETTNLLNETIGRLGQSDLVLTDSGRESKNEAACLESHTSVVLSDTSYPGTSQTWSTPESMNAEVVSGTSSYRLFKSRIDPGQFTSSPLPNISDSSSGPCQELVLPSSSLNLSSVEEQEHISASDSLDMSLEEGNKAFVQIDTLSNEQSQSLYNDSGDVKNEAILSDSSVSLSVSLGERPDCVGQSCSSDSEAENENVETSDKSYDSNSSKHASNILSSTRNSQKDLSLERKGPVIISPLSIDMSSPSLISFEQEAQPDEWSLTNKSFLNDLPQKNTNLVTEKKKNLLKQPTQSFSASKTQNLVLQGSSSSSSTHQNAACSATSLPKQDHNPVLIKSKKVPRSTYSTNQLCKEKSSHNDHSFPLDSFHDTSSVYFSPGKSSRCHKGLSPFSPISNISNDNQMKPEGAKVKVQRQVVKKNHDKRSSNNSSSNRRHRGILEHRRSRLNNKENTDLSDFDQSGHMPLFDQEFICSSRDTPHISKDSGLGACRKSYQSPQIVSLPDSPALTVAGASTGPTENHEIKRNRQPIVDGFRLRNKKAVMKKFWNFQKKFIRKNPQNKDDTEFKTLAHI